MRIDLHSHSTRSDGRESVTQVFETAAAAGLDVLALTDHDTASGWAEATAAAQRLGLGFVPGIEVTTTAHFTDGDRRHSFSVHMLAYLVNPDQAEFAAALAHSLESRKTRIIEMVDVISADYAITMDDVLLQLDQGATQGRPAIADALIAKGYFVTREAVFKEIWGSHQNGRYYIPNRGTPDVRDAIRLIRAAGGVPVIAHPLAGRNSSRSGAESRDRGFPRDHFVQMIEAGLAGFEVEHREVDEEAREWLRALAAEFDLIMTGSSDYHGMHGKPNRLGENTTTPAMLQRILEQGRGSSAVL